MEARLSLNPELTHSSKSVYPACPGASCPLLKCWDDGRQSHLPCSYMGSGTQALVFTPQVLYLPSHYPQSFLKELHPANSLVTVNLKFQVPCWFSLEAVIAQSPKVWRPAPELRKMSASSLLTWCLFPVTSSMEGPLDMDCVFTILTSAQYIVDVVQ